MSQFKEQNFGKVDYNVNKLMDGNPKEFFSNATFEDRELVMGSCGYQYFTKMECFDEAFDVFRNLIEKRNIADAAMKIIIEMEHCFTKAVYQSQINKGLYNTSDVYCIYRQIFKEETLAACLGDFEKDGDLFWNWAVDSLTLLGYKH